MANLYLLRHAKSDWEDMSLSDHDRPLSPRGEKAAANMGRTLARQGLAPEIVLCSTALRARATLDLVMEAGDFSWPVQFEPALYGASVQAILSIIRADAGSFSRALLVGHNPGFHYVAKHLVYTGESELLTALDYKYPTGTFADIEFPDARLNDISPSAGVLKQFLRPRDQTNA
ncbi:SixA phosphatase family protein [Kordiimonas sp.]|uniref:SixA phosphatase family protein n=1 Tax=Kordiimonas sp. TaxID=1970157 RepID=UPI003A951DE5